MGGEGRLQLPRQFAAGGADMDIDSGTPTIDALGFGDCLPVGAERGQTAEHDIRTGGDVGGREGNGGAAPERREGFFADVVDNRVGGRGDALRDRAADGAQADETNSHGRVLPFWSEDDMRWGGRASRRLGPARTLIRGR
jgi:hypothetical protein